MNDPLEAHWRLRRASEQSCESVIDSYDNGNAGIQLSVDGSGALSTGKAGAALMNVKASMYSLFSESFERELAEEEAQRNKDLSGSADSHTGIGAGAMSDSGEGSIIVGGLPPTPRNESGEESGEGEGKLTEILEEHNANPLASVLILLAVMFFDRLSYWGFIMPLKSTLATWGWSFGNAWSLVIFIKGIGLTSSLFMGTLADTKVGRFQVIFFCGLARVLGGIGCIFSVYFGNESGYLASVIFLVVMSSGSLSSLEVFTGNQFSLSHRPGETKPRDSRKWECHDPPHLLTARNVLKTRRSSRKRRHRVVDLRNDLGRRGDCASIWDVFAPAGRGS